jgi:hypothetical protein
VSEPIRELTIALAGAVAEQYERGGGELITPGARRDVKDIDEELAKVYGVNAPPREQCREYKVALSLARQLLTKNWGAVQRIAERLRSHKQLSGALCHAIVAAHRADEQ